MWKMSDPAWCGPDIAQLRRAWSEVTRNAPFRVPTIRIMSPLFASIPWDTPLSFSIQLRFPYYITPKCPCVRLPEGG